MQLDGQLLAMWGHAVEPKWRPDRHTDVLETVTIGTVRMRLLSVRVDDQRYPYIAAVLAPLQDLEKPSAIAAHAAAGRHRRARGRGRGRLVARPPDAAPLGEMAAQAAAITESNLDDRLRSRHEHDELGRLAPGVQRPARSSGSRASRATAVHGRCLARAPHVPCPSSGAPLKSRSRARPARRRSIAR